MLNLSFMKHPPMKETLIWVTLLVITTNSGFLLVEEELGKSNMCRYHASLDSSFIFV